MTKDALRMAMAAMAAPQAKAGDVPRRLGITTTTLYEYVNGDGSLKQAGQVVLDKDDCGTMRMRTNKRAKKRLCTPRPWTSTVADSPPVLWALCPADPLRRVVAAACMGS